MSILTTMMYSSIYNLSIFKYIYSYIYTYRVMKVGCVVVWTYPIQKARLTAQIVTIIKGVGKRMVLRRGHSIA